ncbi:pentapeptide repeat-containing protein [Caballeronia sp. 15711]|uniref:pentapeptide repeat-containing protein n=1 Tax=Caballeronia sp. 15711 TaxID=3391029 RepID=UPI0039E4F7D9
MLTALSGKLSGKDLSSIALLYAGLHCASLAGVDLSEALLIGDVTNVDLSGAKLEGTNFRHADISLSNFSYAELSGIFLPYIDAPYGSAKPIDIIAEGADWWKSAYLDPSSKDSPFTFLSSACR